MSDADDFAADAHHELCEAINDLRDAQDDAREQLLEHLREHDAPKVTTAQSPFAPHGSFTIHANDHTRTPDDQPAVYVICACGRGYCWERKIPSAQLATWLTNHGPDITTDEEKRRVKTVSDQESTP